MCIRDRYKPIDVVLVCVLTFLSPVIVVLTCGDNIFGYTSTHGITWTLGNLVATISVVTLRIIDSVQVWDTSRPVMSRFMAFVADFCPLPLLFYLTHETSVVPALLWGKNSLDSDLQAAERAIWGCQPAQTLSGAVNSHVLGEYLSVTHVLWPVIMFGVLAALRQECEVSFSKAIAKLGLVLIVCMLIPIAIPVRGPPPNWQRKPAELGFYAPQLVQWLSKLDPRHHFSTPCQRVAMAVGLWSEVWKSQRCLAYALIAVFPAMAVATVYGGWNYTLDVLAGLVVGMVVQLVGERLVDTLQDWTHSRTSFWHGGGCCVLSQYKSVAEDPFGDLKDTRFNETDMLIREIF
eukprot:TRINITY_DN3118_c0_g1_i1.p1 TRINITY_DN3118_c0_g1~~TRINITY_DN3118_c0_g1_i1.p1  ORF type:complete len:348 (+),score=40.93 TRINITY_DN3118_c0_g1_i1:164-1207(+)